MNAPDPESAEGSTVRIGRLNGAWGVSGWVKVFSYTDPPENVFSYQPWQTSGPPGLLRVSEWRRQGPRLVARIEEIESRESAERLAGTELEIPSEQLPEAGPARYYWKDLIGLEVSNLNDEVLGRVQGFLDSGAHDVLVIRRPGGGRDHLVPFVQGRFVHQVDLDAGRIEVDWDPEWTDAD